VFFWMLDAPFPFILVSFVLAFFALYRHGSNITRLSQGRENRL
jgi:glycerol-3-phosphate acyltransferase PlsY